MANALPPGLVPSRFTDEQFEKRIEAGIFPEGVHAELLDGIIMTTTNGDPHDIAVEETAAAPRRIFPAGWSLSEETSFGPARSWRPEPDVVVRRGHLRDDRERIIPPGCIPLVVEVCGDRYDTDRGYHWSMHAECRVAVADILP